MKILFCTDGSNISYDAIRNFKNWFNDFHVDILNVSDLTYLPDNVVLECSECVHQCANNSDNILKQSKIILENEGIKVTELIKKCGNTVDNVLELEQKLSYDFIVMGSNGKKGLKKWLGSVSQEVASQSETSVYISKTSQKNKNILFPVTYSYESIDVVKTLFDKIDYTDAKIFLLSAYEMPDFLFLEGNVDSNWILDVEMKQQSEAMNYLKSIEKLFINEGFDVADKHVIKGSPDEEIRKYITANDISLVVCGMRKRKSAFSLSSVSRRIVEYADCDVLINKQ